MLALTVLFFTLASWQFSRLSEKNDLVARVEARYSEPATPLQPSATWSTIDPIEMDYRPITAMGHFEPSQSVLVFDNLIEAKGQFSGVGYWMMTPFYTTDGGIIWVNKGFLPDAQAVSFLTPNAEAEPSTTIEGIARRPERANSFTPEPNPETHKDWLKNPERLSLLLPKTNLPVAPFVIDLPAGELGALPQGGETQLSFPNRHLEYAGTWLAFALVSPIMLFFWFRRQKTSDKLAQTQKHDKSE